ncbi:uncharacterized protein TNIN_501011 [Trichonephila inaurata madagascariensis]|uniref:Chitin-binding type-2 domain-containing protein n=2 Tax=Trichonephila inaurata madagascariensis TaxID=2747483 RepID=A0A8X6WXA9_9ARAC|nr:uncharacterized protein TNIN_501011 [Trichonephila inaurata madagascariensis]
MSNVFILAFLVPVLSEGFQVDVQNNSIIPDSGNINGELDHPIFKCDKDGFSPNPLSCKSYIKCSHHRRYVMPCKEGYHFSNETGQCEPACDAHCDQSLACECGWSTCEFKCEEPNMIYKHPEDCRKFVKCYDRIPIVLECSKGLFFNINKKRCLPKTRNTCE